MFLYKNRQIFAIKAVLLQKQRFLGNIEALLGA